MKRKKGHRCTVKQVVSNEGIRSQSNSTVTAHNVGCDIEQDNTMPGAVRHTPRPRLRWRHRHRRRWSRSCAPRAFASWRWPSHDPAVHMTEQRSRQEQGTGNDSTPRANGSQCGRRGAVTSYPPLNAAGRVGASGRTHASKTENHTNTGEVLI